MDNMRYSIGDYVKITGLATGDYGGVIEDLRRRSVGRICRVTTPYEGSSDDGVHTRDGQYLVTYVDISKYGLQSVAFYTHPDQCEIATVSEELILLYSPDIWHLIRPFGELQDTSTFKKFVDCFGFS
jgi:hypothetical protein